MEPLTLRRRILGMLREREMDARELSRALGIREAEVLAHLGHVARTAAGLGERLTLVPSRCLLCGFVFEERRRLTRPGRCPRCRRSRIEPPRYVIR
ncbi:MAG: ArsR family transcriptional regulator [Desulfobacterales bacterium]